MTLSLDLTTSTRNGSTLIQWMRRPRIAESVFDYEFRSVTDEDLRARAYRR